MMRLGPSMQSVLRAGKTSSSLSSSAISRSAEGERRHIQTAATVLRGSTTTSWNNCPLAGASSPSSSFHVRWFETEAIYHSIADEALESIQDGVDEALDSTSIEYEITNASGVLTMVLPPNGTWVINKQSPNQQLWWSSPLSGPKRFEYDPVDKMWICTQDGLSLGPLLVQEIRHVTHLEEFKIDI